MKLLETVACDASGAANDVSTRYDYVFYTLGQQEPLGGSRFAGRNMKRSPASTQLRVSAGNVSRSGWSPWGGTGAPGLPASDDWTAWDAAEMRAAVDYLERMRIR